MYSIQHVSTKLSNIGYAIMSCIKGGDTCDTKHISVNDLYKGLDVLAEQCDFKFLCDMFNVSIPIHNFEPIITYITRAESPALQKLTNRMVSNLLKTHRGRILLTILLEIHATTIINLLRGSSQSSFKKFIIRICRFAIVMERPNAIYQLVKHSVPLPASLLHYATTKHNYGAFVYLLNLDTKYTTDKILSHAIESKQTKIIDAIFESSKTKMFCSAAAYRTAVRRNKPDLIKRIADIAGY